MKFVTVPPGEAPPPRRRRSKPVPQKRGSRMFIGAIAGVVLALGVFGAVAWQRLDQLGSRVGTVRLDSQTSDAGATASSVEKASVDSPPVYRYSVIPGGVRTPEELLEAMANDSVVAAHHSGLDKTKLTSGRLNAPLKAHVSYRIGDRVYWTNRKVTIPAGEQVLTDGNSMVRARCGNGISVDPLLPALDNEPKPEAFDSIVPHVPANTVVKLDPADSYLTPPGLTPPVPAGSGPAPFGTPSIGGGFPGPPPPGNPGTPGTSANPTSGDPPPAGVPPVDPPVDPPKDPPKDPPGNPPGNPPGDDPPGGDPPTDFPPQDVPNTPTPVPEPGTLLLVAAGAAALLAHRVRKKTR